MLARLGADLAVVAHLLFIMFVVLGGFLSWRWPRIVWAHVPVALWGALVEIVPSWKPVLSLCPLTHLENYLRHRGGDAGYESGFIEHYIVPIVYPPGITPTIQLALGFGVVVVNAVAYTVLIHRRKSA